MGWIRRLLGRAEQRAPAMRPRPQRPPAGDERDSPFHADADAARPANVAAVDVAIPGASARTDVQGRLEHAIAQFEDPAERDFLATLSEQLKRDALELPPMPEAALRVQRLVDSPDCSINDLAGELERDPALATRVVGIANSPFYAGLESVESVRDAVVRIGLAETRNIVLAITLRAKLFRVPGFADEVQALWEHSIYTAATAQLLVAESGSDPEPAFLVGLVHDVGRIVLFSLAGEIHRRTRGAVQLHADNLQNVGDILHAGLGALVSSSWKLSPSLVRAVQFHDRPEALPIAEIGLASVLAAADLADRRRQRSAAWAKALERIGLDLDAGEFTASEAEAIVAKMA